MGDTWHYVQNGLTLGPISWEQLQQLVAAGAVAPNDLVWQDGMAAWAPAATIPGLVGVTPPQPDYGFPPPNAGFPPPGAVRPVGYYTPSRGPVQDDLTGFDWVLIVLCSGIACIIGIVRAIQGKPSGGKMIGYSVLFIVIWTVLRVLLTAALPHR